MLAKLDIIAKKFDVRNCECAMLEDRQFLLAAIEARWSSSFRGHNEFLTDLNDQDSVEFFNQNQNYDITHEDENYLDLNTYHKTSDEYDTKFKQNKTDPTDKLCSICSTIHAPGTFCPQPTEGIHRFNMYVRALHFQRQESRY